MSRPPELSLRAQAAWLSIRESLRQKSAWLAIGGIFAMALSPLAVWLTVNLSVSFGSFPFGASSYTLVIDGLDATWNTQYGPFTGVRSFYVQLLSMSLAFLTLSLDMSTVVSSKKTRGSLLLLSAILGASVPLDFVYLVVGEGQKVNAEFQQITGVLASVVKPNYSYSIGVGLLLAIIGPILVLLSSTLVFREKSSSSSSTNDAPDSKA